MKALAGGLLLALAVAGCTSAGGIHRHKYNPDDVALLKQCFAEVVRANYAQRNDGELSNPTANGRRFVFNYHEPVDGTRTEMIDLAVKQQTSPDTDMTAHIFYVVIHRVRSGVDPVLKEDSERLGAEIEARMASRKK
jgi:hypothetical protein